MRHLTKGFTLLEILIVLVIAASVMAFAFPAYKKAQNKNKYMTALGVLQDLGTSVIAFRQDLAPLNKIYPVSSGVALSFATNPNSCDSSYTIESATTSARLSCVLIMQGYMQPIAWDAERRTVRGYQFTVCPQEGTPSSSTCCGSDGAIACMKIWNGTSSSPYYGARVYRSGNVEPI